jgi:hypothetical protein
MVPQKRINFFVFLHREKMSINFRKCRKALDICVC